jgi:hypothetical protein
MCITRRTLYASVVSRARSGTLSTAYAMDIIDDGVSNMLRISRA